MKRSQAADLIDVIRLIAAEGNNIDRVREELLRAGLPMLEPCDGEAHLNPFIDNCHRCAPRWGWVGAKEPVT